MATLTTDGHHANPHGTVHGAVFYAVAGAAVAAAANDEEHSGIVSSVLVEYLRPAAIGDVLQAEIAREVSTDREDIFTGTVRRVRGGPPGLGARPGHPPSPTRLEAAVRDPAPGRRRPVETLTTGSAAPRSAPARANTASNMGSVRTPVKVFCWLGWYEHRSVRPSGSGVLGQVAEVRPGPQAVELGHALAGELAQDHDDPHVLEELQLAGQVGGAGRPFARARACWPAGRSAPPP